MAWNNVLLSKKFILYKEGISNKSVEEFFIQNKVDKRFLIILHKAVNLSF